MQRQTGNDTGAIWQAMATCRPAMLSVGVFSFFANLLMLTGPLFMLQVYDRVLTAGSIPTLVALALLVVLLYGLFGFLDFIRGRVLARVARTLDEHLQDQVFHAISYHALHNTPDIRTRPAQDLAVIRQFLSGPAPFSFLDLPWAPIYLFVIFLLHWWLGVASLAAVIILALLALLNNALTQHYISQSHQALQLAAITHEETRRNSQMAFVLGMLDRLRLRWRSTIGTGLDNQTKASDRGGAISSTTKTLRMMFQSGILGLGAYLAVQQEVTPGTMIAASIIMGRALAPVEQVVGQWAGFLSARTSWSRLDRVLTATPSQPEAMPLPAPKGHLKVDNLIAFAPGAMEPIISGINFQLPAGTGLGVIGPTGAGKSTLAKALIGAWPNIKGKVRLDGATIDQWDPAERGKFLGYLSQDAELFEGTIGENISRLEPDADPQAIVAAARAALVHELVLSFPDGYNTRLGENGANLSAGQRQRIGLARALYGDPVLIVLDEPNANLDAEGEAALVRAIAEMRKKGSTVIVVAHRPSAISALDMIMVIKDGKQIAFGPKDEVLSKVLAPSGNPSTRKPKQLQKQKQKP